jgi:hypothetical protein
MASCKFKNSQFPNALTSSRDLVIERSFARICKTGELETGTFCHNTKELAVSLRKPIRDPIKTDLLQSAKPTESDHFSVNWV